MIACAGLMAGLFGVAVVLVILAIMVILALRC